MTDPATKDDVNEAKDQILARLDRSDESVENMRAQNSAEHGSLFTKMLHLGELMHWLKQKWERFTK